LYLFSKKIKCKNCEKNFRGINERNKRKYVCSTYSNYSSCIRHILEEDRLLFLVQNHWEVQNVKNGIGLGGVKKGKFKEEERRGSKIESSILSEYVKQIFVDPVNQNLIIYYQDGSETFISSNLLKF
jgi:hypothetical protein